MQPARHTSALKMLPEVFHDKTINLETTVQRVQQMSSIPTRPENMRTTPRVHSRVTRNNTPGLIAEKSIEARSEGERNKKNSPQLATSEGEESNLAPKDPSTWYAQPREKRRCVTEEKTKPTRRSKRFTKEQNTRMDAVDTMAKEVEDVREQESFIVEGTNFELGMTPHRRNEKLIYQRHHHEAQD